MGLSVAISYVKEYLSGRLNLDKGAKANSREKVDFSEHLVATRCSQAKFNPDPVFFTKVTQSGLLGS